LILTVTLNPAIDLTYSVDRLAFEDRSYINSKVEAAGGRGINAARVLTNLGAETLAMMPSGGATKQRFDTDLARLGFRYETVAIEQAIRTNLIVTDKQGLTVKLNERGPQISPAELDTFTEAVERHLPTVDWLLICGSLPPGVEIEFYRKLIRLAKARKISTLVDTEGEFLQEILDEGPTVVIPNQSEAEHLLNKALITRGQFLDAVERIQRMGADMAVLSLGNRGAVAFNGEQVYEIIPPRVEAVSPIGAGDALDAAFAWAMSLGKTFADAARWGVAAGTASAMLPGIQFGTLEQTQAIYDKVEVKLIGS
jgi:1-phosphofructokinase family hexose kinase